MASLKGIGREQVLAAIAEYDRLGQDEFLSKYGFKPARDYAPSILKPHPSRPRTRRGRLRRQRRH